MTAVSLAPEHDWTAANALVSPLLRPAGTVGLAAEGLTPELLLELPHAHTLPLVDPGPAGLVIGYALSAEGFDILVNGEHLLSWHVPASEVRDAAMRNLAEWSANAEWSVEDSGERRLVASSTGSGRDAARILLPEARARLLAQLVERASTAGQPTEGQRDGGRVMVGLPERDLLVAGVLAPSDPEFGPLFAAFVRDQHDGADEPIDPRVLELVDGSLVEFTELTGQTGRAE